MSKAEERGKIYAIHKASEKLHDYYGLAMLSVVQFDGNDIKNAYKDGHQQAEKDLALTWEDVALIASKVLIKCKIENTLTVENICKDVLKEFKTQKGE